MMVETECSGFENSQSLCFLVTNSTETVICSFPARQEAGRLATMALRLPAGAGVVGLSFEDGFGFSRFWPEVRVHSCGSRGVTSLKVVRAVIDNSPGVKQRAKLAASRVEKYVIQEAERPIAEYMRLPASQYSVLDAERIERVDENTFRCYAPRLKFFSFEVGPVLLVRVEEQSDGCCIRLLSCTLEGSPLVVAQNEKFTASMVNRVSYRDSDQSLTKKELISDTTMEVTLEIPGAVSIIPKEAIEGTGSQVLAQVLKVMIPRFLVQLGKDYNAWATGDSSRKPLGTGEL